MADLPAEFSEGTLQRALEQPDDGAIAIAWGDNRKRLLLIKRRIEILGGSVELRDRAGPFAQKLTALNDRFLGWFREPAADGGKAAGGSSRGELVSLGLVIGAAIAALVYAHGARDPHARLYALRGGAFTLGLISAHSFLRGARRWYDGEGAAWLSALLVLVPTSTLMAAGYQGYKLGLVEQGVAALQPSGTASKRPLMKPFQALIVELRHRKQRAELAAVMAEEQAPAAGASAEPQPLAVEQGAGDTPVRGSARDERGSARGRKADPLASSKRGAAPLMAAGRVTDRRSERAIANDDPARAWALRAATTIGACLLAASTSYAAATTGASGFAAWSAIRAGSGEVVPAAGTPVSAAVAPPIERTSSIAAHEVASSGVPRRAPAPSVRRSPREHAPDERAREWEPLRSLGDVNVLHVAAALVLSLLTFGLGIWTGRRPAKSVTLLEGSAAVSRSAASALAPSVAPSTTDDASRFQPHSAGAEPSLLDDARAAPEPAGRPAPAMVQEEDDLGAPALVGMNPANDARTMPDHASAAITAASAAAHKLAEPAAQKPAKARAAAAARGGIQEETVVRRRTDHRRED